MKEVLVSGTFLGKRRARSFLPNFSQNFKDFKRIIKGSPNAPLSSHSGSKLRGHSFMASTKNYQFSDTPIRKNKQQIYFFKTCETRWKFQDPHPPPCGRHKCIVPNHSLIGLPMHETKNDSLRCFFHHLEKMLLQSGPPLSCYWYYFTRQYTGPWKWFSNWGDIYHLGDIYLCQIQQLSTAI